MAGNTKRIRCDAQGKPAPQYFNTVEDAYEYLEGEDGASKIMAEEGKIADLATLKTFLEVLGTTADADSLNTMIGLLKNLKGKDFATQTTLEAARALLETISGLDFAEETTLDALKTAVESIKSTDGIKKIVDALPAGTNEIGKIAADAGKIADLDSIKTLLQGYMGTTSIEFTYANAIEIRDDSGHYFLGPSETLLRYIRDFEIYVTDSHYSADSSTSLDLIFSLGRRWYPLFTSDNKSYTWEIMSPSTFGELNFLTTLKGHEGKQYGAGTHRRNLPLSEMIRHCEFTFRSNETEEEGVYADPEELIRIYKRIFMDLSTSVTTSRLMFVRFPVVPTAGSITIKFRGWL